MWLYHTFLVYVSLLIVALATARFNEKLKYYEVIDSSDISHHIRKRDVGSDSHVREVTVSVLGRTLALELVPKEGLFSNDFYAVTIDGNGNERRFGVRQDEFYKGYLKGKEKNSSVTAQIHDRIVTAAIETENDTYHIEPASGHIGGDTSNKMIAYRESDVIWNLTSARNHKKSERFCGMDSENSRKTAYMPGHNREARSTRERRSLKIKLRCELVLVADYRYYEHMGQQNKVKATQLMVGTIHRVDELFRKTDFSDNGKDSYLGYGFVIKKIIIHETATSGYNKRHELWAIKSLLEEFSRENWSGFCLAHLFTYQDFADGVIGLAYVASPEEDSRGGICSRVDREMWHNTGLSSSINWGNQLLTTEADIVTAHEFGHNFGSEHDVQNDRVCSPETDGKYIMYPASVSGQEPNNKKFSICSRRAINSVLQKKAGCFVVPDEGKFCGNFRVEGDEECDSGNQDRCCTSNCKFKEGAKCSQNYETQCCDDNCGIANKSTMCSPAQPRLCRKASFCDGTSATCPEPEFAEEGTDCIERGKCDKDGKCMPFCKTISEDSEPCLCSNDEDACFVCCKREGVCKPYQNGTQKIGMANGRLCYAGVCSDGKCKKQAQDIITRLKDFIDTLADPSKFGEFLKDNIVGTVIVFSLMAWIPLGIIVHRIDKRRDKHAQDLARWQDIQNNELIRQPNRGRGYDVVFKKDAVFLRDSRKAGARGASPH